MITSPIFIIGCPRSGTTLLYNILSELPELYSIGYESKAIIERYHHPREKNWESGALEADDLTPESRAYIEEEFERLAAPGSFWRKVNRLRAVLRENILWQGIKRRGRSMEKGSRMSSMLPQGGLRAVQGIARLRNRILPFKGPIRLLEKTPENCLRLPFLLDMFPDARIIYLIRDGRANVNSLMEGWRQPHIFPGYRVPEHLSIPGITRDRWAFTLIPGWRDLVEKPLEEVCAWQWVRCNQAAIEFQSTGRVPYYTLRYEDLVASPSTELHQIAGFIEVDVNGHFDYLEEGLPYVNVVTEPDSEKWRKQNAEAIGRVAPILKTMQEALGYH